MNPMTQEGAAMGKGQREAEIVFALRDMEKACIHILHNSAEIPAPDLFERVRDMMTDAIQKERGKNGDK